MIFLNIMYPNQNFNEWFSKLYELPILRIIYNIILVYYTNSYNINYYKIYDVIFIICWLKYLRKILDMTGRIGMVSILVNLQSIVSKLH